MDLGDEIRDLEMLGDKREAKRELIKLIRERFQVGPEVNLEEMNWRELINYIVDNHRSDLAELHLECRGDSNSMHPNETAEEFHEHEDSGKY